MFDFQDSLSLCFLFAAIVINIGSLLWILDFKKNTKNRSNLFIAVCLFLLNALFLFVVQLGWSENPFLFYGIPFALLYGPLFWFASLMIGKNDFKIQHHLWHFLPLVLFFIPYVYCLFYQGNAAFAGWYIFVLYIGIVIQMIIYIYYTILNIKKLGIWNNPAYSDKTHFFYYIALLLGGTLILFFSDWMIGFIPDTAKNFAPESYFVCFFLLGASVVLYRSILLHWRASTQHDTALPMWNPIPAISKIREINVMHPTAVDNDKEHLLEIALKIAKLPPEVFRDKNLNLAKLSDLINEPAHLVTRSFNEKMGANFSRYVNTRRLAYATKLLRDTERDCSVSEVAFRSGFNSDTSFYRIFKEAYRTTPKQYQKDRKDEYNH